MYYLQSRYYNPEWGRFLNADDIIDLRNKPNLFAYCANNPIMNVDTNGHFYYIGSQQYSSMPNVSVSAASVTGAFVSAATGYDTIAGGYVSGGASVASQTIANNIYHGAISNSSSRVEAYRKLLDVANEADKYSSISTKITGTGIKSIGTKLGVGGAILGGGIQIGSDLMNPAYSRTNKMKAVAVDSVQMGASIASVLIVSSLIPGVGWGIAIGIGASIIIGTGINYGAQAWKDEWID